MTIKTWSGFSKRKNSTKQPTGGSTVTATLKEKTSIENPTFILASNDFSIDYVYAFGKYYFVRDITSAANGLIEVSCDVDVMATYKTNIAATSAFVVYTTGGNTNLIDPRLPKEVAITYTENTVAFPWNVSTTGSARLGVTGINGAAILSFPLGGLWAFLGGLTNFSDNIFNTYTPPSVQGDTIQQIKESMEWLGDMIGNFFKQFVSSGSVADNIRSCCWVPFDSEGVSGTPVYLGQFNTGYTNAGYISTPIDVQTVSVSAPWPATMPDWRRATLQMYIYLPFVGVIQIPAADIMGQASFSIKIARNRMSGTLAYQVDAGSVRVGTYGAETGCDYPVGVATQNIPGVVNSLISVGAGIASGGVAGAALAGHGIVSAGENIVPTCTSIGGISSAAGAGLDSTIRVWSIGRNTSETPGASASIHGIPYMKGATISGLSGYIQTQDASVAISGSDMERDAINEIMNTGFYYE